MMRFRSTSKLNRLLCVTAITPAVLTAAAVPAAAQVLPTGPSAVDFGGAPPTIGTSGQTMTVTLNDSRTIINWNSFNIGSSTSSSETVQFTGASGAVLNRVVGPDLSRIYGSLLSDSDIQVFLINPNGVLFGSTANVNVGSLVASSLDIADIDFINGDSTYNFTGVGTSGVIVQGGASLRAGQLAGTPSDLGHLVLVGGSADIGAGATLTASGDVVTVAASDVTMSLGGGGLTSITISQGTPISTPVVVSGNVSGRNVYLAMATRSGIINALLNVSGTVTATTATATDRGVVLAAGTSASGVTVAGGGGSDTAGAAGVSVGGTVNAAQSVATANADLELRARDSVTGAGSISAADDIDLSSNNGSINLTGSGTAGAGATYSASGDITLSTLASGMNANVSGNNVRLGRVESTGGSVAITGTEVTGIGAGGRAQLVAKGTGGNVTVNGGTLVRLNEAVANQNVNVTGDAIDLVAASAKNGSLSLIADAGNLTLQSAVGRTSAQLTASGALSVSGRVLSVSDVMVSGGTSAAVGTAHSTNGNVSVTGDTVSVGTARADVGSLTMTADNGNLTLGTGIAGTTSDVRTTGGAGDVTVSTSLTSGGSSTLNSVSDARLARVESLTGNVSVTAAGEISGVGTGGRGSLVANGTGGDIEVDGGTLVLMNEVVSDDQVTVTADTIDISSVQARNGALNLTADVGDLTIVSGSTRADAILSALRDVNVIRRIIAIGNINITAGREANVNEATSTSGTVVIVDSTP